METTLTKGQLTQNKLLQEANRQFSQKGYDATGVDSIVEALGLTSGVFYAHFSSKKDLLTKILQIKIQRSRERLITPLEKESAADWLKRALKTYLSIEHRDALQSSCPMTTLSQELMKLNLETVTGLEAYSREFAEVLNRRLMMMSHQNQGKATAIMSLCLGAITLARLEKDVSRSNKILSEAYEAALSLVELRK